MKRIGSSFLILVFCLLSACEGERSSALLDDLLEAEEDRDKFKSELSQKSIELEGLKSRINQMNLDLQSLQIQEKTLSKERENLDEDLKKLRKEKEDLDAKLIEANNALRPQQLIQKEKELLEKDLDRVNKTLDETVKWLDNLNDDYSKLNNQYKQLSEDLLAAEATTDLLINRKPKILKVFDQPFSIPNFFHFNEGVDVVKIHKFEIPANAKEIRIAGSFKSNVGGVTALIRDKKGLDSFIQLKKGEVDKVTSNWVVNDVRSAIVQIVIRI